MSPFKHINRMIQNLPQEYQTLLWRSSLIMGAGKLSITSMFLPISGRHFDATQSYGLKVRLKLIFRFD